MVGLEGRQMKVSTCCPWAALLESYSIHRLHHPQREVTRRPRREARLTFGKGDLALAKLVERVDQPRTRDQTGAAR